MLLGYRHFPTIIYPSLLLFLTIYLLFVCCGASRLSCPVINQSKAAFVTQSAISAFVLSLRHFFSTAHLMPISLVRHAILVSFHSLACPVRDYHPSDTISTLPISSFNKFSNLCACKGRCTGYVLIDFTFFITLIILRLKASYSLFQKISFSTPFNCDFLSGDTICITYFFRRFSYSVVSLTSVPVQHHLCEYIIVCILRLLCQDPEFIYAPTCSNF